MWKWWYFSPKKPQYLHLTYNLTFQMYIFFSFVVISGQYFEAISLLHKTNTEISPGRFYTSYVNRLLCFSLFTVLFSSLTASI